jgi:hypothetical protein
MVDNQRNVGDRLIQTVVIKPALFAKGLTMVTRHNDYSFFTDTSIDESIQ